MMPGSPASPTLSAAYLCPSFPRLRWASGEPYHQVQVRFFLSQKGEYTLLNCLAAHLGARISAVNRNSGYNLIIRADEAKPNY